MSEEDEEICAGCDHLIALHFKDIREVIRCTNVDSGTSSRGVIGIPYSQRCDCKNYVSQTVERQREEAAVEESRWQEAFKTRLDKVKQ